MDAQHTAGEGTYLHFREALHLLEFLGDGSGQLRVVPQPWEPQARASMRGMDQLDDSLHGGSLGSSLAHRV